MHQPHLPISPTSSTTPDDRYLELREQPQQVHITHRDDYAAVGMALDSVRDLSDVALDSLFGAEGRQVGPPPW